MASPRPSEIVESALSRNRTIVTALAGGVVILTAASGFLDLQPVSFAVRAALPVGLAGLVALVLAWRAYGTLRERASDVEDVETGCVRYGAALLLALAITEGIAFLGVVCFLLGGELVALTGVFSHVLLTGVLWPTSEKIRPFLGRAGNGLVG